MDNPSGEPDTQIAMVVDLDGTLVRSDLLYESVFDAIARQGWRLVDRALWRDFSYASVKAHFARLSEIDYATLPFNETVLAFIVAAKDQGRKVYLATVADRRHAEGVARQIPLFDGIFASEAGVNLKGDSKAEALKNALGEGRFDYIGNSNDDFAVWRQARRAFSIGLSAHQAGGFDPAALVAALRPHQYAKNALIFVPLLTSQAFTTGTLLAAFLAFVAFSLCASGVYLLNDLLDIQADRGHPSKRLRPFASGRLSPAFGVAMISLLTLCAFAVAALLPDEFLLLLAGYLALTNAYSLVLKKRMIADVVTLAILYTLRIFAGAAAIDVVVSNWLFILSLMMFTALVLTKRHIELAARLDKGFADPSMAGHGSMVTDGALGKRYASRRCHLPDYPECVAAGCRSRI